MEPNNDSKTDNQVTPQAEKESSRGMLIMMLIGFALFALLVGWELFHQSKLPK